jgi:hypothetical protein
MSIAIKTRTPYSYALQMTINIAIQLELKFVFNWIEFKYIEWNLNSIKFQFNYWIQFFFYKCKMVEKVLKHVCEYGVDGIENMFVHMVLKNKIFKKTHIWKTPIHVLYLGMG